jgi:hypothetical protein
MIRSWIVGLGIFAASTACANDDPNNKELAWWRIVNEVMDAPGHVSGDGCVVNVGCYSTANDGETMLVTFSDPKARLKCPFVIGKSVDCLNFVTGRKVRLHKDKIDGHWSFPGGLGL